MEEMIIKDERDLEIMKAELSDIDRVISEVDQGLYSCDQFQLQRLKKRKDYILQCIRHIEKVLHPDIIA